MSLRQIEVNFQIDVTHATLPAFAKLSVLQQQRFRQAAAKKLFGNKEADVIALTKDIAKAWRPKVEDAQNSGHFDHLIVQNLAVQALAALNTVLSGGSPAIQYKFVEPDHGAHGGAPAPAGGGVSDPGNYHCVRWVWIDGHLVAVYNYALSMVETHPDPSGSTVKHESRDFTVSDWTHKGNGGSIVAGLHMGLLYQPDAIAT